MATIRYIKLGEGGRWERECLSESIVRFGFGTARDDRFSFCMNRDWGALRESFLAAGRVSGVATNFKNQVKAFFEDDGSTTWITFVDDKLYYATASSGPPERHPDGDGVFKRTVGGWKCVDANGEDLRVDRLRGDLVQYRAFRGASCKVDISEYVLDRIAGRRDREIDAAIDILKNVKSSALTLLRRLQPKDFEILIDLIFSRSGWQRLGLVGGVAPTLDLCVILPTTGERAFVQVKCQTTQHEFVEYAKLLDDPIPYSRMFYVFHTGEIENEDDRITLIGPDELPSLVLNSGLFEWVIEKC